MTIKAEINETKSGQHMVLLKAANHEIIMWSEEYTTLASAERALNRLREIAFCAPVYDLTDPYCGIPAGNRFEIDRTSHGQFMGRFRASNREIMVWSESYVRKQGAEHAVSLVRNGIKDAAYTPRNLRRAV